MTSLDSFGARQTLDVGNQSYDYFSLQAASKRWATSAACPSR